MLVQSFNEMLVQIEQRDEELRAHRENLEEEVARRTAELLTLNVQFAAAKEAAESRQPRQERVPGQHEP